MCLTSGVIPKQIIHPLKYQTIAHKVVTLYQVFVLCLRGSLQTIVPASGEFSARHRIQLCYVIYLVWHSMTTLLKPNFSVFFSVIQTPNQQFFLSIYFKQKICMVLQCASAHPKLASFEHIERKERGREEGKEEERGIERFYIKFSF